MKKTFTTKVLSMVLMVAVIASIMAPAFASESPQKILTDSQMEQLSSALEDVAPLRETMGLKDVDFTNLYLGSPIPAYEYIENGLTVMNISYYPLFSAGELVAFAMCDELSGSFNTITALVPETKELISANSSQAFVYDRDSCYLLIDGEYHHLVDSEMITESRNDVDKCTPTDDVPCSDSNATQAVPFSDVMPLAVTATCNVSYVTQNGATNYCWAATVACIGNYLTGKSKNAIEIAQSYWGTNYNKSLDPDKAMDVLKSQYNKSYTYKANVPTDSTIYNNLVAGYPLYGRMINPNTAQTHAVTIYSYSMTGGYIAIMDPEYKDGIPVYSKYTSGVGYRYGYTSPYSGNYMYLCEYCSYS